MKERDQKKEYPTVYEERIPYIYITLHTHIYIYICMYVYISRKLLSPSLLPDQMVVDEINLC